VLEAYRTHWHFEVIPLLARLGGAFSQPSR
jgi:hypothetical protein